MNDIVQTTLIGMLGTGLIGMFFYYLRDLSTRFASLEASVRTMDTKFTGAISELDTKFTGTIKDLEIGLSQKFTAQFKEHGERLARIEAKLDVDPLAEAV